MKSEIISRHRSFPINTAYIGAHRKTTRTKALVGNNVAQVARDHKNQDKKHINI